MKAPTVAFIGADGAGKSTVTREVVRRLSHPAVRVYMGVNLQEANFALPLTRLAMALKRRRGGRPDLSGWPAGPRPTRGRSAARDVVRVLGLVAEEWYRAGIIAYHRRRGRIVVMDRHFLADYWHHDVNPPGPRPWIGRLHGYLLRRWYPRPDHIVFLDAPPEMLHRRKPEGSLEHLVHRRAEYADFGRSCRNVTIVSADASLELVVGRCLDLVERVAGLQEV